MEQKIKEIEKQFTPIQVEKDAKNHLQKQLIGKKTNLGKWVADQIYKKYPVKKEV